jgi:hypothetical protein
MVVTENKLGTLDRHAPNRNNLDRIAKSPGRIERNSSTRRASLQVSALARAKPRPQADWPTVTPPNQKIVMTHLASGGLI